jgi:hypothetical protein
MIKPVEDFWSRRANAQAHAFRFAPLGTLAEITANTPDVLEAARLSSGRFSRGCDSEKSDDLPQMHIHLVVSQPNTPPPPDDWPERLVYSGTGEWITLSAGEWGHGFGNLATRTALVFFSPALAAQTRLISRYFIDHYLLNFLFGEWAMLHASGALAPGGRTLILLIGDHNAGKSTTALRLLRAGHRFLADGMALIRVRDGRVTVGGYPVGEVKLRDDVLALFPEYSGAPVQVREQRKTVVDLRAAHPGQIIEELIQPASVTLCFTERAADRRTAIDPITAEAAQQWLAANTVYWDEPARLETNSKVLSQLLLTAKLYHLALGSDIAELISKMEQIC